MEGETSIETARLRLRRWRPDHAEPFAALNADPEVMRYFPGVLSRTESDAMIERIARHFERRSFGPWAAEEKDAGSFIGFIGLAVPSFEAHFQPCIEIGWRLARPFWGAGLASEGARAALGFGFDVLGLKEIVSFTATSNEKSWQVMQRIDMRHDPADDFDHPALPEGHWLRRHVLYRMSSDDWATR